MNTEPQPPAPNLDETPETDALDSDLEKDAYKIIDQGGKTSDLIAHSIGNLFKKLREQERQNNRLCARVAELEKTNSEYRGLLYGCDKHRLWSGLSCIGCLEDKITQLETEAASVRGKAWRALEDEKRLDWLERNLITLYDAGGGYLIEYGLLSNPSALIKDELFTVRQCIDAAIKQEQEKG